MNSLNSILLEGNLVRSPEQRSTPKGTPVCAFTVASNRYFRVGEEKQNEVSYFDVETWASLADRCAGELDKGRGVRIVGRLKQDRWVDQEGKPRSHIKVVAEHVEFRPLLTKKTVPDPDNPGAADADDDDDTELAPGTTMVVSATDEELAGTII